MRHSTDQRFLFDSLGRFQHSVRGHERYWDSRDVVSDELMLVDRMDCERYGIRAGFDGDGVRMCRSSCWSVYDECPSMVDMRNSTWESNHHRRDPLDELD